MSYTVDLCNAQPDNVDLADVQLAGGATENRVRRVDVAERVVEALHRQGRGAFERQLKF